jgi:serine/threonine protein kinase
VERSTFGKYVLLRKLATGGMGEVFLAKQVGPSGFEKLLVIKRILAQHHDKREYLNMFLGEAKLVAQLTHSNIIQIHEMGQIDGDFFIAMEYVRGRSLRDVIDALRTQGKTLPLPYAIDLAIKLCDGLGYAHDAKNIRGKPMNIIHRDINPHNVLISYGGDLKIIDFGIAKSEMSSVHTATGTIKGKFVYMSPEQSAADPIDKRSDIFSLGIVLYEMITGENPFVRQNVVLSLEAIQRQPVTPPSVKRLDAGPLDVILERALEKRPEERYQDAHDMRDDLRNLLRSGAVRAPEMDLGSFLHELFRAEIEDEDRLLAEADRATTPPRPASSAGRGAVPPSLPANLPSMPLFSQPPTTTSGREASVAPSDQDTRADRVPRRTPQPMSAAPFADDEPTLAGDPEDMAARSRLQSMVSKVGGWREPTGQVLTLIPPEELAPGTHEEYGADDPQRPSSEPDTRRDRVGDRLAAASSASQEEAALPVPSAISDAPRADAARSDPPRAAALGEPLGSFPPPASPSYAPPTTGSRPPPPPRASIPFSDEIVVPPRTSNGPAAPSGVYSSASGANGSRAPAFGALVGEAKAAERRLETARANALSSLSPAGEQRDTDPRPSPRPSLPPDDQSGSMPAYTGLSRRTTVVGGLLVVLVAGFASFFAVQAIFVWASKSDTSSARPTAVEAPRRTTAPVPEPARDPLASPSGVAASASPTPLAPPPASAPPAVNVAPLASPSASPLASPLASARPVASPVASPLASPTASPIASPAASARPIASPSPVASARPKAEPTARPEPTAKAEPKLKAPKGEGRTTKSDPKSSEPKSTEPKAEGRFADAKAPEPKVPEPKPEPTKSADAKGEGKAAHLGSITLSASQDVTVEHEGRAIGSAPSSILVRRDAGTITLGAPDLPYTVKLAYRVGPEGLVVKVDASPWAIVKHNGISLGRTPQDAPEGRRHRISLLRPGQANALDVTLLWSSAAR